jgi:hypothetical protein
MVRYAQKLRRCYPSKSVLIKGLSSTPIICVYPRSETIGLIPTRKGSLIEGQHTVLRFNCLSRPHRRHLSKEFMR